MEVRCEAADLGAALMKPNLAGPEPGEQLTPVLTDDGDADASPPAVRLL